MNPDSKKGYVIVRTLDHKQTEYITCDYVEEHEAEQKYNEIATQLQFPQELLCRKAWLEESKVFGRYWIARTDSDDEEREPT